jgi:hypothetical protein
MFAVSFSFSFSMGNFPAHPGARKGRVWNLQPVGRCHG